MEGVTFRLLLFTRWNSLVACFKICSLLVVEVACCKKSLITRSRSRKKKKITCYLLQNSLVIRCQSCSLQKNHLLLVAKFARYSLGKLIVAKYHSLLVAKSAGCLLQKLLVAKIHLLLIALPILIATYYVKSLLTRAKFN